MRSLLRGAIGCTGWVLTLLGLFIIIRQSPLREWMWLLIPAGLAVYTAWLFSKGDRGYILPGLILIVSASSLIIRHYGLIDFPVWRIWALFFISFGAGFLVLWAIRYAGGWAIMPGLFLIFIGGAGFAASSWELYLRWLREVADHWHVAVAIGGLLLVILHWRSKSS